MNKEERKPVVKELAAELYKVRTGAEEAPVNKISQQDYHMALVSLLFFQKREKWEYGVTFSVNGKDSMSFPDAWHPQMKDAKEDLDWYVRTQGITRSERVWRIVKRPARLQNFQELDETDEVQ